MRLAQSATAATEAETRRAARQVIDASESVIDLDEVECPRCGGRGTTGLMGDLCAFCRGSQVVSQATADEYDPSEIDEVECPRCGGRGTTGLVGDTCDLCHGRSVVARATRAAWKIEH
jgi:DnaJ-class molecular chaperone